MSTTDWATLIFTVLSTVVLVSGGVRFLVRHYFQEIKAELKPNGGSSMKDQVNRLEKQHITLQEKLDRMYEILLDHVAKDKD